MTRRIDPEGRGTCRSCGAAVLWVEMVPSGKKKCLNPEPSPEGNIDRRKGLKSLRWYGKFIDRGDRQGRELYVSHFATCPQADEWRRR